MNDITKKLINDPDFQVMRFMEEEQPLEQDIYELIKIMQRFPILDEYTRQLCILADCIDKVNHKYLKAVVAQIRIDALGKMKKRGVTSR